MGVPGSRGREYALAVGVRRDVFRRDLYGDDDGVLLIPVLDEDEARGPRSVRVEVHSGIVRPPVYAGGNVAVQEDERPSHCACVRRGQEKLANGGFNTFRGDAHSIVGHERFLHGDLRMVHRLYSLITIREDPPVFKHDMIMVNSLRMFGFLQPAFRYDPNLLSKKDPGLAKNDPSRKRWRHEGKTVVFGPEYAAGILDEERILLRSGRSADAASLASGVLGITAHELRESFPDAVRDAKQFQYTEKEIDEIFHRVPLRESREPKIR